ncbi:MAG TPA: ABC transporter permease [Anaerohalosphaeraceae bacterium]|nr:ABC transporter permease [Anaerohalosphaeraceae bacterium]HOL31709.1 ABC transporter permease [Anaerohalosphaeraceae bacterium]HPC64861.1 ABC transporter permease [Anaerohalosphaeraceae bacterium]HRS71976.1 ABC transporter permease [Anaerohalosphaeraceae bacterium]HRV21026.1 ABC transporter permease [Anaerohalosphaeraceae bacterium]
MTAYIIRRLLYMIPIVIGVLLLTFVLFTLVGGDISQQIAGKNADAETIAEIRHEYGFDKPLFLSWDSQFLNHFKKAFTFHFGRALDRERISEKILRGVGPSLALTVPMFFGTLVISISFALVVAFLRGTVWDHIIVILCVAGMSLPYLSFIIFGQYFFAYKLDWFPIFYAPDRPMVSSIVLPVLIGIAAGLGSNLRFYRTIMLDEIRSDYVRTAFAKGLTARRVLFKHVLKNAMIPIVTNVVLSIPYLILGSLLLERFFGIPGLGYLMYEAVSSRDFFVLNAMTFIMALLIAFFTLVADLCYAWVDPRVKFE